ncbi:MAG: dethiobiotin synthase [Phycisphaeraceae bacterium]|nr:dethiobiotin synthase [Phycisphaeraceae bacterium]
MPVPDDTILLRKPRTPGLFITGTDTGVGKTVIACCVADQLRRRSPSARIGVFKPIASGCRHEREGLVSEDAEQLAHAADFDPAVGDLGVVNPVRFRAPIAPGMALERENARLDWTAIDHALGRLDEGCERIIVEGVGGALAPIDAPPSGSGKLTTALDLMERIGYPVVVVCRAGLGTLNHTALTCEALRSRRLRISGLVVNGYEHESDDESMQDNLRWLTLQTGAGVLAAVPWGDRPWDVRAIHPDLRAAIDATDFGSLCKAAR